MTTLKKFSIYLTIISTLGITVSAHADNPLTSAKGLFGKFLGNQKEEVVEPVNTASVESAPPMKVQTRRERIMGKLKALQADARKLEKEMASSDNASAEKSFAGAAADIQKQLDAALTELSKLREQMADEKIPLSRKLNDLEGELVKVRLEYQKTSRLLDSHTLDLSNLRNEIKTRQEESTYLSNLLSEYIRNFESRLHISEIQRYREELDSAKLALENTNLDEGDKFAAQAALLTTSLDRLNDALSGTRFAGTAVDESGLVKHGNFILIGPAGLFLSDDEKSVGTVEQRLGSLEPTIIGFEGEDDMSATASAVKDAKGFFPLDPSLGNAHKIEETKETLMEHIKKGGPVMVPIFLLAGAALMIALYKWATLAFIRIPSHKQISAFLKTVSYQDKNAAMSAAVSIGGPIGNMLVAGVEHLKEPHELIEEVMYENMLAARLKLQSFLPFVAISASSAPLLGLLGTVTGIMNTFTLITVFGSGDVKTLSSGISEALITTEYGLIVAIPSLLLHAFLSRKARGVIDEMEKSALAFINQLSKIEHGMAQKEITNDAQAPEARNTAMRNT